ncbi:MAG: zinc-ribbon domain-containing protein, partial [Bacteroidetes bacterium]|nr:zinc-ribbon domain-containing protein [Bacteroidota bacterium]
MIIQCRQCRTKFHFDDVLMEGDGVWMRCGSCQHVFFQDNPLIIKPNIDSSLIPEAVFSEESMLTEKSAELSKEG